MLTALPDGTIIGHESLVEDTHAFDKFVAMPEVCNGTHRERASSQDAYLLTDAWPF